MYKNLLTFLTLIVVFTQVSCSSDYKRKSWKHWTDEDKNCFNTRQEILKDQSIVPVEIKRRGKKCFVKSGEWNDYYYPEILTSPGQIDIDHIIPLKHAHDIGGSAWTKEQKEIFANDPENLVITNKTYNRRKGSKRIDQWLPLNLKYACQYYRDWMKIKNKYNLPVSKKEREALDITKCSP